MRKAILFAALVALALLFPISQSFAQSEAEITEIRAEIQVLEQRLVELGKFSEEFNHVLGEEAPREVVQALLSFDIQHLDLMFKLLITKGIFDRAIGKNVPEDSFVELQMLVMAGNKQTPLQFVGEMLPLIRNGIDLLEKEKENLQKIPKS